MNKSFTTYFSQTYSMKEDLRIKAIRFETIDKFWTKKTILWIIGLILIWFIYTKFSTFSEYILLLIFFIILIILIYLVKVGSNNTNKK
jgi:cell division protein FtsW (lipid II flippase)